MACRATRWIGRAAWHATYAPALQVRSVLRQAGTRRVDTVDSRQQISPADNVSGGNAHYLRLLGVLGGWPLEKLSPFSLEQKLRMKGER